MNKKASGLRRKVMPRQQRHVSRQDYATPKDFIVATKRLLRIKEFSFDFAATKRNAVATRFFTKRDNALNQMWQSVYRKGWSWLNPPFDQIAPWASKASHESELAMLVPASVGSNWWRDYVHAQLGIKACVLFLNKRITFRGQTDPYPKDCALILYGYDVRPGYYVWNWQSTVLTDRLSQEIMPVKKNKKKIDELSTDSLCCVGCVMETDRHDEECIFYKAPATLSA